MDLLSGTGVARYLVWRICRDSQWEPMGAQITSIVFPPMRSELTKLNKSAHPQSRILSPFISTRVALKIVLC